MDYEAIQIVKKMPIKQKIGQMIILGIPGKKINNDSISIINKYLPGGIVLFGYNLGNTDEIKNYIRDLQKTAFEKYNIPLFISIDQEGGRVKRIQTGVTQFPGNMAFGIVNDKVIMYSAARILGIELRNTGFNMNLAPVLDVNNNPMNPVINTRSFSSDAGIVSSLGASYVRGLQKSGCIAVGKHFPGHGDTDKDSHLTLPVIRYDIKRLQRIEFPPFVEAIESGLEAVMTAHISFPNILGDNSSATISKKFLTEILRKEMRFNGIIITDDLEMNAVSKVIDIGEAAVRSIEAGADIILISTHGNSIDSIALSIEKAVADKRISTERIDESANRIIEVKLRYNIFKLADAKIKQPEYKLSKDELKILQKADELNRKISREAIYFYSKKKQIIPVINNKSAKLFITVDKFFSKLIGDVIDTKINKIFSSEKAFLNYAAKHITKDGKLIEIKDTTIYYQFDIADPVLIEKINKIIQKSGAELFLLCTGDPFPLGKISDLPPVLISFSNTEESIRQMISCLKGEFKPKENIPLHLGFNGK